MGLAANDARFIQGKADDGARVRYDILALQDAGHLKTIDLKTLPAPKGKNGKGSGA